MVNIYHVAAYICTLCAMAGGTALGDRRADGDLRDSGDPVAYALTFAGMAVGIPTAQFLLLRWDDPVNFGVAGILFGVVAVAVKSRR
jgi:hypothetical protein